MDYYTSYKNSKDPSLVRKYWQFKIKAIAEKAVADNKRINGAMIKRQYNIPYSVTLFSSMIKMNLNCLLLNSSDTISLHIPIISQSCMTFVIGSADFVYSVHQGFRIIMFKY